MRGLVLILAAACVALACAHAARADGAPRFDRTIELASRSFDVRVEYAGAAPGSTALSGEGELRTRLLGDGYVALRVPHTVGRIVALGDPQVTAGYALPAQDSWRPDLSLAALVDLPTVAHATARPGAKLVASKEIGAGLLRSLHVEGELRTLGLTLAPSPRAAIGARFGHLDTTGSLNLVFLRPPAETGVARSDLAELALAHALDPRTTLRLQLGATVPGDADSQLRVSAGIDLRF